MAKTVLWRFSKIKTLEVREISAPTITWKLEVGLATVFSTILTLSPILWWFDYMWQVWFLAIKLHTLAIGITLSLLFFNHVSIWGQQWELWRKQEVWEFRPSHQPPSHTAGDPDLLSSLVIQGQLQTSREVDHSPSSQSPSPSFVIQVPLAYLNIKDIL